MELTLGYFDWKSTAQVFLILLLSIQKFSSLISSYTFLIKQEKADLNIFLLATEKFKYLYYISVYNMNAMKTNITHSPTLESVLMVEKAIEKYSQECGKYQLWKKLPRKIMYQTYLIILDYLQESGKIIIDKDGCVIWIWNPQKIRGLKKRGLKIK